MKQLESALDSVQSRKTTQIAALDIGSNSFHLVVARIMAGSVQILHKVKQKVRLADGLGQDNRLSNDAIKRGVEALKLCQASMQGCDSIRIVATYSLRKAVNANAFIKAAKKVFPYPVEVISGAEEARLIYQGVAHTFEHQTGKRLVVDIGGGSTEFVIGQGFNHERLSSLSMGCVSFQHRYFAAGELKNKAFKKAITAARQELERIDKAYLASSWDISIGSSGTISMLAKLSQEVEPELAPDTIRRSALNKLMKLACDVGHTDKLKFDNLNEDRRDVFAAGLAILIAVFDALHIDEMSYSPAALREGVLYEMEDRLAHNDIRERTAESLATRYDVDIAQAKRVLNTTEHLYSQVADAWDIQSAELKHLLGWAAMLHEVGLQINSRGMQRHSAYIIANADLPGFNQEQQQVLSALVGFHRKKIRLQHFPELQQISPIHLYRLISLLRLGALLNIRRQDDFLPPIRLTAHNTHLALGFPRDWLEQDPLMQADLETEAEYQKALGIKLCL